MLVHVLDCATLEPGRDPVTDLDVDRGRARRSTAACDATGPGWWCSTRSTCPDGARAGRDGPRRPRGARAARSSRSRAATHEGLRELTFAMAELVAERARRAPGAGADPDRAAARAPVDDAGFTVDARRGRRLPSSAATSPSAGSGRPTSPTTRPSATSPTGWPGSASRTRWPRPGAEPGDRGRHRRARTTRVVFDWRADARSTAPAPRHASARARAARDRRPRRRRWRSRRATVAADGGRSRLVRRPPGRGQGRLVVADHAAGGLDARPGRRAGRRARRARARAAPRSCWSPPARSPPGWPRSAWRAARATWPPSRPPPASGRACWSHRYTERVRAATAVRSARCC